MNTRSMNVLISGATGCVGGRLVDRLLREGTHRRRLPVRDAARAEGRSWPSRVEIVAR